MAVHSSLGPVARESTPSIIARELRSAIGRGELAPGQQLPEAELARTLGVSRGPLREAMQRLTQEGLLVSIRNRGLFVIELTQADVRDIYAARMAIESAAAAQIIAHDPAVARARFRPAIRRMTRAIEHGRRVAIGEADLEFHQVLVDMSSSPRLKRMHLTLLTETRMCMTELADAYPGSDTRVQEHEQIAAAIAGGDAALATKLLDAHMEDAVVRLTKHYTAAPAKSDAKRNVVDAGGGR